MRLLLALLLALEALAQTPLENHGAPMLVPYTCTGEDVDEAGLRCSDRQPCPVYLELNAAESLLSRIFLVGNLHAADATLYSILLASDDAGKTWTEPQPRTRFSSLEQIQFFDFERGWISGANVQGVPRDPFFLLTDDGGKSWRQRPIFDESRTGVVERFWFDSKNTGELLITTKLRHELYETKTGGESWSLRQFSPNPLSLRKDRTPGSALIRVRADAKSHSYQVEKRQGEAWTPIAAFLVEVGKCKEF
jgi:hypothetical protein